MRSAIAILLLLTAGGCGTERITGEYSTPAPPGPAPLAVKFGYVFKDGDVCIDSATVRVVRGQSLDRSVNQQTPCDFHGGIGGWVLDKLVPDGCR